jgi:glycosyltransferase involved in cell wall biosynthesis
MKIAIMLRHIDEHGGGVMEYTRRLLEQFFAMFRQHQYFLLYRTPNNIGSFGEFENVHEVVLDSPSKPTWDQIAVPRYLGREKPDIVFNPKYSFPLLTSVPGLFVCHGLDWYVMPWGSRWIDRLSHKFLVPLYSRKASAIIAVSETTKDHVVRYLNKSSSDVVTVYHGVDESFRRPVADEQLQATRKKFSLPPSYYLYVSRIYPPKNFGRLIRAFARVSSDNGRYLVVAGTHTEGCEDEIALIEELGISNRVIQLGWVDRDDLPALYSMADTLVQPSLYESFGISLVEAMSIGCPILTANCYGAAEVTADAALLVDPEDVDAIEIGLRRIVDDTSLRETLIARGFTRSKEFTWEKCAAQTMSAIEDVYQKSKKKTR